MQEGSPARPRPPFDELNYQNARYSQAFPTRYDQTGKMKQDEEKLLEEPSGAILAEDACNVSDKDSYASRTYARRRTWAKVIIVALVVVSLVASSYIDFATHSLSWAVNQNEDNIVLMLDRDQESLEPSPELMEKLASLKSARFDNPMIFNERSLSVDTNIPVYRLLDKMGKQIALISLEPCEGAFAGQYDEMIHIERAGLVRSYLVKYPESE